MGSKNISEIEFTKSSHFGQSKKVVFSGFEMISSVTQVTYTELLAGKIIEEHLLDAMKEVFLVLDVNCEFCLDALPQILTKDSVIKVAPKIKHKIKALTDNKVYNFGLST